MGSETSNEETIADGEEIIRISVSTRWGFATNQRGGAKRADGMGNADSGRCPSRPVCSHRADSGGPFWLLIPEAITRSVMMARLLLVCWFFFGLGNGRLLKE